LALITLGLPVLLWMRRDIVLHAGAAVRAGEDAAVVWLGPSGSGKSTALREELAEGARIVADDTVRLFERDGALWVAGLPGLLWDAADGAAPGMRAASVVPPQSRREAAPLGGFSLLGGAPLAVTADRLGALLANRYRANVARLLGDVPAMLSRLGRIAVGTPFLAAPRRVFTP
jgi:hypothetical protein